MPLHRHAPVLYSLPGAMSRVTSAKRSRSLAAPRRAGLLRHYLGLAYDHGLGVQRDYEKARSCYEDAARNGNSSAQCGLGVLHLRGLGGQTDWISASYWFLKAVADTRREAIHNLHWIIARKDTLPTDTAVMIDLYRDAALRGEIDAQYVLAWCYEHGVGIPTSRHNAIVWYERTMKLGHLYADVALARLKTNAGFTAASARWNRRGG